MRLYFHFDLISLASLMGNFYKQIATLRLHRSLYVAILSAVFLPLPLLAQVTQVLSNESSSQAQTSLHVSSDIVNSSSKHSKPAIMKPKHQENSTVNTGEWMALDKKSQQFLFPLKSVWHDLSKLQQRKWVAIAVQSGKMSTAEIEILHQRMRDWALLSSSEREKARINFNKVNQLSAEEKLKNWHAYQALSEQEKASLIQKATPQKGLALQNASTAIHSKNKASSMHSVQPASPQHPAIANSKFNTNKENKNTEIKPRIQAGTLLPETTP